MVKVTKLQYDNPNTERKDVVKEITYLFDLKTAFKHIRNEIVELENSGKENYWCMKSNTEILFWDAENKRDYTSWNIEECE